MIELLCMHRGTQNNAEKKQCINKQHCKLGISPVPGRPLDPISTGLQLMSSCVILFTALKTLMSNITKKI